MKVLLVDDDRLGRVMLAHSLRARDIEVTEAESAQEALSCWQAGGYDCVVSDILMPDMNGVALAQRLRELQAQDNAVAGTRLVALTASINGPQEEAQINVLFDAVLHKPVAADTLYRVLTDESGLGQ